MGKKLNKNSGFVIIITSLDTDKNDDEYLTKWDIPDKDKHNFYYFPKNKSNILLIHGCHELFTEYKDKNLGKVIRKITKECTSINKNIIPPRRIWLFIHGEKKGGPWKSTDFEFDSPFSVAEEIIPSNYSSLGYFNDEVTSLIKIRMPEKKVPPELITGVGMVP